MAFITSLQDLRQNLSYFESEREKGSRVHAGYVKRGTCFVAYDGPEGVHFAPSRFLGYKQNTFETHAANSQKDGRETNPEIAQILGSEPEENVELKALYGEFCQKLGFKAHLAGAFGAPHRFWDLRG